MNTARAPLSPGLAHARPKKIEQQRPVTPLRIGTVAFRRAVRGLRQRTQHIDLAGSPVAVDAATFERPRLL
jgi:hypothetical protein